LKAEKKVVENMTFGHGSKEFLTFIESVLDMIKKMFEEDIFLLALLGKFLRLMTQLIYKALSTL